jgi:hypothetical protein
LSSESSTSQSSTSSSSSSDGCPNTISGWNGSVIIL